MKNRIKIKASKRLTTQNGCKAAPNKSRSDTHRWRMPSEHWPLEKYQNISWKISPSPTFGFDTLHWVFIRKNQVESTQFLKSLASRRSYLCQAPAGIQKRPIKNPSAVKVE